MSGAHHLRRAADGGLDLERDAPADQAREPPTQGHLPGHFIASQPRKGRVHITQKPVEIMRQLVQICPEDGTVLDPFTGSGSTGVAALREGRNFLGVELSTPYADIAERRLRAELTQDDFVLAGPEERGREPARGRRTADGEGRMVHREPVHHPPFRVCQATR